MKKKFSVRFWQWLAWLLPKSLVYHAGLRLWVHGTSGNYSDTVVPELTVDEALRRWHNETV